MPSKHKARKVPQLKIERGIPVPKSSTDAGYASQLRQMKSGDSILFPPDHKPTTVRQRGRAAFGTGGYAVRTVKGGVRLWRVK